MSTKKSLVVILMLVMVLASSGLELLGKGKPPPDEPIPAEITLTGDFLPVGGVTLSVNLVRKFKSYYAEDGGPFALFRPALDPARSEWDAMFAACPGLGDNNRTLSIYVDNWHAIFPDKASDGVRIFLGKLNVEDADLVGGFPKTSLALQLIGSANYDLGNPIPPDSVTGLPSVFTLDNSVLSSPRNSKPRKGSSVLDISCEGGVHGVGIEFAPVTLSIEADTGA